MPRTSLKSHYGDRPLPFCHLTLKDWLPILLLPPAELGTYVAWFTLYHANGKAPVPIADLCRLLGAYRKTVDRLLASLLERKLIWIGDGAIRQGRACLEEIEVPERFRHVLDGVEYPVRYVAFWVDRWRAALDRLNPQESGVYLRLWVLCCIRSGMAVSLDDLRDHSPYTHRTTLAGIVTKLDDLDLIRVRNGLIVVPSARAEVRRTLNLTGRGTVSGRRIDAHLRVRVSRTGLISGPKSGDSDGQILADLGVPERQILADLVPPTRYTEKVIGSEGRNLKVPERCAPFFSEKFEVGGSTSSVPTEAKAAIMRLTTRPKPSPEPLDAPAEVVTLPIKSPPKPFDPDKDMWDRAVAVLGGGKGCRGIIGRAVKEHGRVSVLQAVETCEEEHPADPVAFFRGCLRFRAKSTAVAKPDPNTPPRSARDVLERDVFPESRCSEPMRSIKIANFLRELMPKARELHLRGGEDDGVLAHHLGMFVRHIEDEHKRHGVPQVLESPHELAWLYLDYLRERGMGGNTLAMFKPDSPIFAQFCGERWQLDAYGRDPLTGRSHY